MSTSPTVKLSGELTDAGTTARRPGHLKWGDIVLKRGVAEVPAWSLLTLRAGQTFAMEVPKQSTGTAMLAELNDAVTRHQPLDLTVGNSGGTALGRASKIEALSIKQKVSEGAPVVEILLRKL